MAQLQVNQTIEDLAITKCGKAEAAFDLAMLNDISVSDTLQFGRWLKLPEPVEFPIVDFFVNQKVQPATATAAITDRIFADQFDETFQ